MTSKITWPFLTEIVPKMCVVRVLVGRGSVRKEGETVPRRRREENMHS